VTERAKPVKDAADTVRPGLGPGKQPRRRTLPTTAAFWILAGLFLILFFASAAASPLYRVYQVRFHFSAATLTAVFAVYVLVLLVTLLIFGSVSDYLGRLRVIITALVFSAAACVVFLTAHEVGALYVARSLQGIAAGLASGPIGAALIDLQPPGSQRAPVVTSVFSTLGLALGALITSALVQYAPAPTHLIWWTLLAVFAVSIITVLAMAEPGVRRPGVLASLRPHVAVPRPVRGTFAGAVPCIVAGWALGGLYLSLGPSLAAAATGSPNLLWGGLVIFLLCGTGAAAAFALRSLSPRSAMLAGCLCLLVGMAVTFGAIATTTTPAFLSGTAVAGVGFGLAFQGFLPDDYRPGRARRPRRPGDGHLHRGLPRVQCPGAARRGRHDEIRAAPHCLGVLRLARRPGRCRRRHSAAPPRRQAGPASPGHTCRHAAGPVHHSAVPEGHQPTGRLTRQQPA
jgi:MFS family permease